MPALTRLTQIMSESISHRYILNAVRRTPSRLPLKEWNKVKRLVIPSFTLIASEKIHSYIGNVEPINLYHLDHIYPISAFYRHSAQETITPVELLTVFHPENYRWLFWKDNLKKSNTYNNEEFLIWVKIKTEWIEDNLLKSHH